MPILDLYEHGDHRKNLAHFATLASLAAVDGEINPKEMAILEKFAFKLNISEDEFKVVMKKENKYPIETPHSGEQRYKRRQGIPISKGKTNKNWMFLPTTNLFKP